MAGFLKLWVVFCSIVLLFKRTKDSWVFGSFHYLEVASQKVVLVIVSCFFSPQDGWKCFFCSSLKRNGER